VTDQTSGGRAAERVPLRTILATIWLVLATAALLWVANQAGRVLTWIVIAAFFAVSLKPVVDVVEQRLIHRRTVATLFTFVVVFAALAGLLAAFAIPLAREAVQFAGQFPQFVEDARGGRGPIGQLLVRTDALQYVQQHQAEISSFVKGLTTPAAGALRGVSSGITGALTTFVLAYLMVLEAPRAVEGGLALVPEGRQERIRRVATDCAQSITGYLSGNLLISVICGVLTYAALRIAGVPFAGLLSLFVAITDLIPMIGATIGAVVAGGAAFVHSVPAGIGIVVFFIVYQQFENHVLQPLVLAKTVDLSPLTVLVAILVAGEIAGILGALLAIPVTGMIQVIVRDLWDNRRGHGSDEAPADGTVASDASAPAASTPASAPAASAAASTSAGSTGAADASG